MQSTMRLEEIGWSPEWAADFDSIRSGEELIPARVTQEQRGALRVLSENGELHADISGRLRYLAAGPEELPGVGDWVAVSPRVEEAGGTIHHVLPRRSALIRKEPDRPARGQLLVANVDVVLVVTSANRDFNARRIERALALIRESGADPVVVLSKLDLTDDAGELCSRARAAAPGCDVVAVSALSGHGIDTLGGLLRAGRTAALIGSSGVGKSTLINCLLGRVAMATHDIREDDDRGRHTTTHRELFPLPGRGAVVDTPGLREIGLWGENEAVTSAFPEIEALLGRCRFHDCGHGNEPGCAIQAALADGSLPGQRWASYGKLVREVARLSERRSAKARHLRRKEMKRFSKMIRNRPDKRRPEH